MSTIARHMAIGLNPGMSNRVDRLWEGDDALPTLIEAAEYVERMMGTPGWAAVQAVIEAEVASIDVSLDHGVAKDAAEYAKAHGRRSALRSADDAARAIIGRAAERGRKAQRAANERATAGESAERTSV